MPGRFCNMLFFVRTTRVPRQLEDPSQHPGDGPIAMVNGRWAHPAWFWAFFFGSACWSPRNHVWVSLTPAPVVGLTVIECWNSTNSLPRARRTQPAAQPPKNFPVCKYEDGWARTMSSWLQRNNCLSSTSSCHIQHGAIFLSFVHHSNQEPALFPHASRTQECSPPRTVLVLISNRLYLARPRSSFRCTQSTRDSSFFTVFTCQFYTGASIRTHSDWTRKVLYDI